jgi:phosphate transport system permease protein
LSRRLGLLLRSDAFFGAVLRIAALISGAVTLAVFAFLVAQSYPLLREVGWSAFFTDEDWAPTDGRFNFVPMLVGTFWAMLGSVVLATPLGIGVAAFHVYYAPPHLAAVSRAVVWLLAGIPSVVYGFWGLVRIAPLINVYQPPGLSLLAGILILAIMILPTMALTAEAAFAAVPEAYIAGARALGLGRWATLRSVAIPAARAGLLTGVILEVGRAIGETMAVIMVMGNTVQLPGSVFDTARTLTANIALEMAYALGSHQRALFVSGLTLLIIATALALLAEAVSRRSETP